MELYHVLNRGVDKREIFIDDGDRARFVHDLYEFNNTIPAPDAYRMQMWDFVSPTLSTRQRSQLVDIHGWVLMRNHYHLLLSECIEGCLTQFIRKINIGYAKYFNERYGRSGALFQGRTKKILIASDAHFLYILHYIHLNPVTAGLVKKPEDWKYSSYGEYMNGTNGAANICKFDGLIDISPSQYKKFVEDQIPYQKELAKIKKIAF